MMRIIITDEFAGLTVQTLLRNRFGMSRSHFTDIKYGSGFYVNGKKVHTQYVLSTGDIFEADGDRSAEGETNPYVSPQEIPLEIIYEDDAFIAVNKPADMPTHTSLGHHDGTLANALLWYYRDADHYIFRPVNRLDRNTTGVVLCANNRLASGILSGQIRDGLMRKSYLALLCGAVPADSGTITGYIKRKGESIIERYLDQDPEGGDFSETDYRVLCRNEKFSLVLAYPKTGRTHQLRVHFASVGCPIAGDDLYGCDPDAGIARQALHAISLELTHPFTGKRICLFAPVWEDMKKLIRENFPTFDIQKIFVEGDTNAEEKTQTP